MLPRDRNTSIAVKVEFDSEKLIRLILNSISWKLDKTQLNGNGEN